LGSPVLHTSVRHHFTLSLHPDLQGFRFRTIIICRFLLTLRAIYYDIDEEEKPHNASLKFASRFIGSLGAPVDPSSFVEGMPRSTDEEEDEEIIFSRDPFTAGMTETSESG